MSSRKIGPYLLGDTLGEGGFAKVRLGRHETTGERVALKILKPALVTANTRANVEKEIAAMRKLNHPNVISLKHVDWAADYVDQGKATKIILIVLELASGGELFDFLSFSGCFEEAIARTYFQQLIEGVGYCHGQGIAHRDLKPENVLLDHNFKLKIADFGFAKTFNKKSSTMITECGTVGYMAPEMLTRQGYNGAVADVWACGVILFITLAGFPPLQKPDASDWWFNKLKQGKHHLFWAAHSRERFFSEDFKDLINKMLSPDPANRMTLADAARHKWMQGERLDNEALTAQLSRRKQQVDRAKQVEKQKQKLVFDDDGDEDMGVSLGAGTVRGLGSESGPENEEDALPSAPPSMAAFRLQKLETTEDGLGFGDEEEEEGKANEELQPEAYDDSVACYTELFTQVSASELRSRLLALVESAEGVQYRHTQGSYEMRLTVSTSLGPVSASAQILALSDKKLHVLRFRRLQGDSSAFRSFFVQAADVMKDLSFTPNTSVSVLNASPSVQVAAN